MIPLTLTITSRVPIPCGKACKCRACNKQIDYAKPAHSVALTIGEKSFTVTLCRACGRMNDAWITDAMRHISLHRQGMCMADKFDSKLVRTK